MGLKQLIVTSFMVLISLRVSANEGEFYIYGKCSLVAQEDVEGFIRFGSDRLWISQFIATKLENPYAKLFPSNSSIRFGDNRKKSPTVHSFSCRYNDITQIRPIASDRLEVTIKGDRSIDLSYGFKNSVTISFPDGTTRELKWEDIVSINFTPSPESPPINYRELYIGSVKSKQGSYFGVIEGVNRNSQSESIELWEAYRNVGGVIVPRGRRSGFTLNDIDELEVDKGLGVVVKKGRNIGFYGVAKPSNSVRINLPTMGNVDVPWEQLESIKRFDISELQGATYGSSTTPKRLVGTVVLRNKQSYQGALAYDLDEALSIEFIEGKNNGITYRLLLSGIRSIEPRNFKYSLITLKSGGRLSIGDSQDVIASNEGILMLNSIVYIPWREVDVIQFEER